MLEAPAIIAGALVELADEVEQELPTGPRERQVAELVEHDHLEPGELTRQGPGLADPASSSSRFTALPLEGTNIKVNAACPGFTPTALNNFNGTRSVEEGAREPV